MVKSGDIVLIGRCKDSLGFVAFVNEDTVTGKRYLSYPPDVWFERMRHIQVLQSLGKEVPQDKASEIAIEPEAA